MLATFLNIGPDSAVFAFKCVSGRGSLIVRFLGVMVSETFHSEKNGVPGPVEGAELPALRYSIFPCKPGDGDHSA